VAVRVFPSLPLLRSPRDHRAVAARPIGCFQRVNLATGDSCAGRLRSSCTRY
jgi:hypothetical protein